jgi:alpha-beta hydrolase superfamily lysophospholipase
MNLPGLSTYSRVVILIAFYFIGGLLGKESLFMSGTTSLVWPPSGIAIAAILLFGYKFWPGVALGAFLFTFSGGHPAGFTKEHGFAPKAALEGMSRGGLIIYNWAAVNPDKVSCIYGDAPVCDFKSWPGGKGKGQGSEAAWRDCLKAYGFTEEQALAFDGNPVDNLQPLADAKIPLLHVVGDADDVVPVAENTARLAKRYRELGGSITVINKPGVGHHPHSLKDPTPIVEFVLRHSR